MAKKKKFLLQMEFFNEMSKAGLSPNQYYLLCCMKDSVSPIKINMHLELRQLLADNWITKDNQLTAKSLVLISELERIFTLSKKRTSAQLLGAEGKKNIVTYREMFPNMKLGSGKAARVSPVNLETAFRWFFTNYPYEWDTVLKATAKYIDDQRKKNFKYTRTSQFFIRKDGTSDLADICDALENDGFQDEKRTHNIKVV